MWPKPRILKSTSFHMHVPLARDDGIPCAKPFSVTSNKGQHYHFRVSRQQGV